jgi:hypothetical protein
MGCQDSNAPATGSGASGAVGELSAEPEPFTAEVVYMGLVEPFGPMEDSKLMRFAAEISNPNPYPIAGAVVEWVAKDSSGAIIGSFGRPLAPMAANEKRIYVGGGPMTAGTPAAVELSAKDPGRKAEAIPSPFKVENVMVRKIEESFTAGNQYEVEADVTTGNEEYAREQVDLMVLLKDGSGKVVGADFEVSFALNIPERLPPNTRFKTSFEFLSADAEVQSAEVYAYAG